ncbi:MAG: hypothetical protein DRO90_00475 [Candidatus Altiarchaeales archaeon]|nr:MAG: hypothetical protein DRO94_02370 [Candidatus Altiarchaeales archaeon]RLI95371.1 MAG: hypothetical protein DRO90_00475 [Candidatus Altiarchaeales archaeon]
MDIDVTSIGDVNVDIITSNLREFPERDSQILIRNATLSVGGCAANFARAIAKLGLNTRLIGKIGNDILGNFIIDELSREGIDLRLSRGSNTGVTIAITFKDKTRSFLTYPGSNSEFTISDINLDMISGRYLHIPSVFLQGLRENVIDLMKYSHKNGMINSFDTGWDPSGWSDDDIELVEKILRYVDIFFPNIKEGSAITGLDEKENICRELLRFGPKIIALKMGSEGCFIATRKESIFIEAFRVDSVDTTGAGDVFNAAFIFGHSKGWGIKEIGRFSSAAAAISTTGYGNSRYPTLDEIEDLLGFDTGI